MAAPSHRGWTRLLRALLTSAALAALAPAAALASFPGGDGVIAYGGSARYLEPCSASCDPGSRSFSGTPGQLRPCAFPCPPGSFFEREEEGIWALDPKTGHQLRLTSGHDEAPSFSPSGNMLAFQRYGPQGWTVFLARADGSEARALIAGSEPAFSPDGRRLVFVRPSGLFVTGITPGSRVRHITDHPGDSEPQWGPRGAIAFERTYILRIGHGGERRPYVSNYLDIITPPSSRVRELFTYEGPPTIRASELPTPLHPDWSPDGRTIAAALCGEGSPPLPTAPAIVFHESCTHDAWAPAGRRLAEAGAGALAGRPGTTCPAVVAGAAIAWQPLHRGTLVPRTVPCESRTEMPEQLAKAGEAAPGARKCYIKRHRRRCVRS